MDVTSKITGDQLTAAEFMQLVTEMETAIADSGQTLASGTLDQISKTMSDYAAGGTFFTDSGAADAYVLSPIGNKLGPTSYADGLRCNFIVGANNTGASTVNVNALGAKSIVREDGLALGVSELVVGEAATIVYDSSNNRFYLETSARLRRPFLNKGTVNIGLKAATTTDANDSIEITGANGSNLSVTNPGYFTIGDVTSGLLTTFKVVANTVIKITGAHWGQGTFGDFIDYPLSVYAINDAGIIKYGVGAVPNHNIILNANDDAVATNIISVEKILVNSALGTDAAALEIGWFKGFFDDTGGASPDQWTVQTGRGDIIIGICPPMWKPYNLTIGATTTPPTKATTTIDDAAAWMRIGKYCFYKYIYSHTNNAGAAAGTGNYIFPPPSGIVIDTLGLTADATTTNTLGSLMGAAFFSTTDLINVAAAFPSHARLSGSSGISIIYISPTVETAFVVGSANGTIISAKVTWKLDVSAPIVGWEN